MNQNPTCAPGRPRTPTAALASVHGFTLVEIMVVVVILGLLATLVVPNVLGMGEEAKLQKAQTDVKAIYDAAKLYKLQNSKVPTVEDLTTPDDKGKTYLDEAIEVRDPWDNEYSIREIERGRFEVICWGPDGIEGTEDDISSHTKKRQ